ncbi:uncharacterized protein LOC134237970 [Saccostrea cucullata]|uniref:uncharacterized protein LOC134237970 n=1 Tax=Saccostrea cuccullata TaxID=36930 RepID=UPI002ED1E159
MSQDIDKSEEIFRSIDAGIIQKSLKGNHVKVHVANLISPDNDHCIRLLNEKHVNELVESFAKNFQPYTTLVGLISEDFTIEDLAIPGKKQIEVLGGNHTRAALQKIVNSAESTHKDQYEFIYMDVYQNLTKDQALFLAYKHNELHEHSQELSFAEKVCFFHRLLLKCQRNNAGQPPKTISAKWRSDIAAIMNKSKTELKNSYKVHLNLAASKNDIWELIKDVFNAFENGCIKGQKRAEQCSQYCFWHFSKVKNNELKISLLTRFKNGEMIPEEFRSACQRCETENCEKKCEREPPTNKQTQSKKRKAVDVMTANQDECQGPKKTSGKKVVQTENENLLDEKEKEIKNLQQTIATLTEKLKHAEQSVEQQDRCLKEKDSKIIAMKKHLIAVLTKAEQQKVTEVNLQKMITDLEEKLKDEIQNKQHAEDAAARARQNLKMMSSGHQKCLEKKKSSVSEEVSSKCSTAEKKINKATKDNSDLEVVLVEYTKGKIYYALRDKSFLTYCHKHIGVIQDGQFLHRPQKLSFKINEKDQQTYEEAFIILSMKGEIEEKQIKIDKLSASIDEQLLAVNNYIREK